MEKNQVQAQGQIQVELGEKEAEGIYSNVVFIAHSPSEVILDFARALPGLPKAKVYARIILTPQSADRTLQLRVCLLDPRDGVKVAPGLAFDCVQALAETLVLYV